MEPNLLALMQQNRERILSFCQRLVQTPSPSGHEEAIAEMVLAEMEALGYDDAITDSAGNVIGHIRGGEGGTVLLHAHMDIVDAGDHERWTFPPFAGVVDDGWLYGRGAADDKGCVAAQVYAPALLREAGIQTAGDVYVAVVVGEEIGGLGTRYLAGSFEPDLAIIGEPSSNTLRHGHRGRFELIVTFHGQPGHASQPDEAVNPHLSMARFIAELDELPMRFEEITGGSTVAPTLIYSDQSSSNVIPGALTVHLDWRNAPGETVEDALTLLDDLLQTTCAEDATYTLSVRREVARSYTGHEQEIVQAVEPFWMEGDDPLLVAAHSMLEDALGREVPVQVWPFYTDGGFMYGAGVPCIGFGPGDPGMAHVYDERIAVTELTEATAAYAQMALEMGSLVP